MSFGLNIELDEIEGRVILRLDGRLDANTGVVLEKKINHLVSEGRLLLLLDFEGIDYLSSAGMRVLLSKAKELKAKGGVLVLFSLSDEVGEIIQMAGFEKILHICSS